MSDKKPDLVVWSEEKGYYAKSLPYGTDLAAPAIVSNAGEVSIWKETHLIKVNHYFESQYNELKDKYRALMEEFRWNDILYNATYKFEPVLGETYYLYTDEDENEAWLSIINPNEWKRHPKFVGAFRLDSNNRWEKVE